MANLKILVCGSRTWSNLGQVLNKLAALVIQEVAKRRLEPYEITIISGGASGADYFAEVFAKAYDYKLIVIKPQWSRYGKSAGFRRNIEMLELEPDFVVAFWDGKSRGTNSTMTEAKKRSIEVICYRM